MTDEEIRQQLAAVAGATPVKGLEPGSEEWRRTITASKVPAILGVDGFGTTRYKLWQQLAGRWEDDFTGNSATDRGTFLEEGIARWWEKDHPGTQIVWAGGWRKADTPWAVATPDYIVREADGSLSLLEVKTSARMDGWGDPEFGEIPDHYWGQIAWQSIVTGISRVHVTVLGTFLERTDYAIVFDEWTADSVMQEVIGFRETLPGGPREEEPVPEFPLLDWRAVLAVTRPTEESADVTAEFETYRAAKLAEAEAKKRAEAARATIVVRGAEAEALLASGRVVARRDKTGKNFRFSPVKA